MNLLKITPMRMPPEISWVTLYYKLLEDSEYLGVLLKAFEILVINGNKNDRSFDFDYPILIYLGGNNGKLMKYLERMEEDGFIFYDHERRAVSPRLKLKEFFKIKCPLDYTSSIYN